MTEFLTFVAGVLAIFGLMVAMTLLAKRAWGHKAGIHEFDDDDTNAMRYFLEEWLLSERILKAMIDTKTATVENLQKTFLALPAMSAHQVQDTAKVLLRIKDVRRVIAVDFMRTRQVPKEKHWIVLRDIAKYAQIEAPRRIVPPTEDQEQSA